MIGYTTLGTNDMKRAAKFYGALLTEFGAKRAMETDKLILWGAGPGQPMLSVIKPFDGENATVGNGVMVALAAKSKAQVDAIYKTATEKLRLAGAALLAERPGWKLVILDALRPRSVQRLFWARVVGTPQQPYVADPEQGSVHNFGFALDVTLQDDTGAQIDMGTGFDDFTALADPQREAELAKAGKLGAKQLENRRLLRRSVTGAGFSQRPDGGGHYDALPLDDARPSHSILE